MIVRLLLVLVVAFALGATTTSVTADAISVTVELDGESASDVDEAQVVAGVTTTAADDHALSHAAPEATAPVPPFRHGVFRPPRVAFD